MCVAGLSDGGIEGRISLTDKEIDLQMTETEPETGAREQRCGRG